MITMIEYETKVMQLNASANNKKLVVHLPTASLPWVTGGREVYSQALAQELMKREWQSLLVFHQNPSVSEPLGYHKHEGMGIQVLPPLPSIHRKQTYGCRTGAVPGFRELMQRLKPAVVHFHDFSTGANLLHLDEAKAVGAKTVMTYHSPGQSCLQRELLYNGSTVCDGEIRLDRCTACRLGVQGIPSWMRWPLVKISLPQLSDSSLGRAISARSMTEKFAHAFREMVKKIDSIHVLAEWVMNLMLLNQVPTKKLCLVRTGLPFETRDMQQREDAKKNPTIRIVMLGRCDPIKGQEVLIDAVKGLPSSANVHVSFFGSYWDTTEYGRKCLRKIEGDGKFALPRMVPHTEIPVILSQSDVMAVPSLWLETGPLVVLEAFASQLPVLGSRLGGIAELVDEGKTGLLFTSGNSSELRQCLSRLLEEKGLLERLRSNIQPPRTMQDVAADLEQLYLKLLE